MNTLKYGTPAEGAPGSVARRKACLEDILSEIVRRSSLCDCVRYADVPVELIEEARALVQETDA